MKWYDIIKANRTKNIQPDPLLPLSVLPNHGWKSFPSRNLPASFNYGHVYHYLVESISNVLLHDEHNLSDDDGEGIDCEDTVTAKPLRKGRLLLKSGFVENTEDNYSQESGSYFVRSHVHHSMKREKPLCVNSVISNISGYVKSASCTCRASSIGRCAHVTALLLMLSDFVSENGCVVQNISTSLPCKWDKGKKREKTPNSLHQATYKSSKRKVNELYNWDPRPPEFRKKVNDEALNRFVQTLQSIDKDKISMWQTIFKIQYSDFELTGDDIICYKMLVENFETSLNENNAIYLKGRVSCEIPGTETQSNSPIWFRERWSRITASVCKTIVLLGEKLTPRDSRIPLLNWIKNKFWFPEYITTIDMQYGIQQEPKAILAYTKVKYVPVIISGLWINKMYPHLGASPDGLIMDLENTTKLCGIIEVKCLKILKNRTVTDLITSQQNGELSELIKRQCFSVIDGKIVLKESHAYYFQIQMQLLVTEYCDFVLHSNIGKPHIQRIFIMTKYCRKGL